MVAFHGIFYIFFNRIIGKPPLAINSNRNSLFTRRHVIKESHPILATSDCLPLMFFGFFCCCFRICHDLFLVTCRTARKSYFIFLRNVHECLQCPPHWNTWGEVSSLTLDRIPLPQLGPGGWRLFFDGFSLFLFFFPSPTHGGSNRNYSTLVLLVSENLRWDPGLG